MTSNAATRARLGSAVTETLVAGEASRNGGAVGAVPADVKVGVAPANVRVAPPPSDSPVAVAQDDAEEPHGSYLGSLAINSKPRGAAVFVNGKRVGTTPLVLDNLHVGSRAVRVSLDGHESWSRAVDVVANQRSSVVAQLQPSH